MSLNNFFRSAAGMELTELYASIGIRNFTLGLIKIFEPIYLFLYFSQSISSTLAYFASIALIYGILAPFSGKIIFKLGIKHSMLASVPFLFLYYLGLWQIESLGNFFFILVPILALHNLFYWPAYHVHFTKFSKKDNRARQMSYRHLAAAIPAAVAPFVGGLLIMNFGYHLLFFIVLALLFLSMAPLFFSRDNHERYSDNFRQAFSALFKKDYRAKAAAFFASGGELAVQAFIWPIFLYTLSINYSQIGLISSSALIGGLLFALYLGRVVDRTGHGKMLAVGSWLNALTWPIKMFIQTPFDAFLVNTLHQFTRLSARMPFLALFYDWSGLEEKNRDRFIIFREMAHNIGKGMVFFVLSFVFLFTDTLQAAFLLASVFALMAMFIAEKKDGKRSVPRNVYYDHD